MVIFFTRLSTICRLSPAFIEGQQAKEINLAIKVSGKSKSAWVREALMRAAYDKS